MRAALGQVRPPPLRLPAHALLRRCPEQRAHRPGLGRRPAARMAAGADGELHRADGRPLQERRPGRRRLDRAGARGAREAGGGRGREGLPGAARPGRHGKDGADPRPNRRHRFRPGHRRRAETLVQPVLQAPLLSRRIPADVQPPERDAGRYRGAGRGAHRRDGRDRGRPPHGTRLPDLRHRLRARVLRSAPASRCTAWMG